MDKIFVKNLNFYGFHGVFPEENKLGQRFIIDVLMNLDLTSVKDDDLSQTINYIEVCKIIKNIVENKTYNLIETLANKIASEIINYDSKIKKIQITVHKPQAPIHDVFGDVSVTVEKTNANLK